MSLLWHYVEIITKLVQIYCEILFHYFIFRAICNQIALYLLYILASLLINCIHYFKWLTMIPTLRVILLCTYYHITTYYYIPLLVLHNHFHYFLLRGWKIGSNDTMTTYYSSPQVGDAVQCTRFYNWTRPAGRVTDDLAQRSAWVLMTRMGRCRGLAGP